MQLEADEWTLLIFMCTVREWTGRDELASFIDLRQDLEDLPF